MTATAPRKSLSSFWDECAFTIGGHDILWLDVAIGAMVRGEWAGFERRLTEGLACEAQARAEGVTADQEAIESASIEFRYERDLISGADVNDWLDAAGLSAADWTGYFTRNLLRARLSPVSDATLDVHGPSTRQLYDAALAEGICSGTFHEFEQTFAGRLSLAVGEDNGVLDGGAGAPLEREVARLARLHAHWVNGRAVEEVRARFHRALQVERIFHALSERLTAPEALQALVEAHRMEWTCLTLDTLSLPSEHAAREAVLCVRVDGLSFFDVSALSRQPVRRTSLFVEDVPPDRRPALLGADVGAVLGPAARDGRFEISRVEARKDPSLEDERVAERARLRAIRDAAGIAMRSRVTQRPSR